MAEVRETFRWLSKATVSAQTYADLSQAHRLTADVVCFKGPHVNHLTPRTLDIDGVQAEMPQYGILPKAVIEGPPHRKVPILLRQTSCTALTELVTFTGSGGAPDGTHAARFGEIEQRGMALTRKGRRLYDERLQRARQLVGASGDRQAYYTLLARAFQDFPDDLDVIRLTGLGFFRYSPSTRGFATIGTGKSGLAMEDLIAERLEDVEPITYEDFLPVSAAGIQLIAQTPKSTPDDLVTAKCDTCSLLADRVLPDLIAAARASGEPGALRSARTLERWDRRADANSRGDLLFSTWIDAMGGTVALWYALPGSFENPHASPQGLSNFELAVGTLRGLVGVLDKLGVPLGTAFGEVYRFRRGSGVSLLDFPANGGGENLGGFRSIDYIEEEEGHLW